MAKYFPQEECNFNICNGWYNIISCQSYYYINLCLLYNLLWSPSKWKINHHSLKDSWRAFLNLPVLVRKDESCFGKSLSFLVSLWLVEAHSLPLRSWQSIICVTHSWYLCDFGWLREDEDHTKANFLPLKVLIVYLLALADLEYHKQDSLK